MECDRVVDRWIKVTTFSQLNEDTFSYSVTRDKFYITINIYRIESITKYSVMTNCEKIKKKSECHIN